MPITPSAPALLPAIRYFDAEGEQEFKPQAKLTVLHFWATWCVPCLKELPALAAARDAYEARGLAVLPLAMDGAEREKIDAFYAAQSIGLPYFSDHKMAAAAPLKVSGLPASVFVNARGEEIARAVGPLDWNAPTTRAFIEEQLNTTSEAPE